MLEGRDTDDGRGCSCRMVLLLVVGYNGFGVNDVDAGVSGRHGPLGRSTWHTRLNCSTQSIWDNWLKGCHVGSYSGKYEVEHHNCLAKPDHPDFYHHREGFDGKYLYEYTNACCPKKGSGNFFWLSSAN